jgi:hypothetical protein
VSLALGAGLALVGLLLAEPHANAGRRGGSPPWRARRRDSARQWTPLALGPGAAAGFTLGAALGAASGRPRCLVDAAGEAGGARGAGALLWLRPGVPALDAFFASPDGLLFQAPVLWLGGAGLALLALRGAPLGRTLAAAAAIVLLYGACAPEGGLRNESFASALPLLGIGLAVSLARIEALLVSRPWLAIGVTGAALTLWNGLFMEQYQRYLIPRDEPCPSPR